MGRGQGQDQTATPSRKQARRDRKRLELSQALQEIFMDYTPAQELEGKEYEIADPAFREAGKYRDSGEYRSLGNGGWTTIKLPVRPTTMLYRYTPRMVDSKGTHISSQLVLDHTSGHVFAVGEVQASKGDGLLDAVFQSNYRVIDCGTDLDSACDTAQKLYDDAWQAYKASDRGKHAKLVNPRYEPLDPAQVEEHRDQAFSEDRDYIRGRLKTGLEEKLRFEDYLRQKQAKDQQIEAEALQLGYELKTAA